MLYSDLRSKTIFDFTNEKTALIIMGYLDSESDDIPPTLREMVEENLKRNPKINANHLLAYAEESKNTALKKAVQESFAMELSLLFSE